MKHNHEHDNHQMHDQNHTKHAGVKHHDHSAHHKMMIADFRKRFFISLIFTIPILVLSPFIQKLLGYEFSFTGNTYVLFLLSSFVFFYGGYPFLKGFLKEIRKKTPGMMTLISLAIVVAYGYSAAVVFGLEGKFFFWELATLIDVMLLGHWIEMRSVLSASNALQKLRELLPDNANLIKENGEVVAVKTDKLKKGDAILIKPGEKIPADGIVRKGESSVNESMLTGESKPVSKKKDEEVIAGSINGSGSLEVVIKGVGEDSYLSKVVKLVREAQAAKSKTQRLADKAALWLTVIAVTTGVATFVIWIVSGSDLAFAIERTATVMVIACPHALGLAIPLVVAVSTYLSAKNGLLIRNRTAFEQSRKISTIVFDKTGTLTEGVFSVNSVQSFNDKFDEQDILTMAASLEHYSEHPIAEAILRDAKEKQLKLYEVMQFQAIKGKGVEGHMKGKNVKVVSTGYLKENNIDIPKNIKSDGAYTTSFVISDNVLIGAITLADQIKDVSYDAIKKLQRGGIKCWMLTGDNEKVANEVSDELNLDGYFAEVLPHEKQEKIKELQAKGEFVAMVGDGVNDAPALAQANVGIAIGSGTDVAAETADIILVNDNPADVAALIAFGKATYSKMVQNLLWATGYNAFAIPLAAGVLYNQGIIISPAIGALLMSLSTVIVAINSRRLKVQKAIN